MDGPRSGSRRPADIFTIDSRLWPSLTLLAALLAGCGDVPGTHRVAVSGRVQATDRAAEHGCVTFVPAEDNAGPTVSTAVTRGRYQFSSTEGPIPGRYRAEIVLYSAAAVPSTPGPSSSETLSDKLKPAAPLAPANGQWRRDLVVPETDIWDYDFQLTAH